MSAAPAITNGDPVRVPAHNLVGRVCGRTIWTPDNEPLIDVLDALAKVHPRIPVRLVARIDKSECPVPPFGTPLQLPPERRP